MAHLTSNRTELKMNVETENCRTVNLFYIVMRNSYLRYSDNIYIGNIAYSCMEFGGVPWTIYEELCDRSCR